MGREVRRDAAAGAVPGLAITGAGALRLAQSGPRWGRRPSVAVESVESGAVVSVDSVAVESVTVKNSDARQSVTQHPLEVAEGGEGEEGRADEMK